MEDTDVFPRFTFLSSTISIGDSTETSPSWASATSSAMETPNDVDQPLAFDFSRKCELNPDSRQQLVLPKSRVGIKPYKQRDIRNDRHFVLLHLAQVQRNRGNRKECIDK